MGRGGQDLGCEGGVIELMEEQDHSTLRLTDEQLAEVRRRRAKKNPKYVSLADARKRFRGSAA